MKNKTIILVLLATSFAVAQNKESKPNNNQIKENKAPLIADSKVEIPPTTGAETDEEAKQKFLEKATKAGIPDQTITHILLLIAKRGEELRALTAENKKTNSTYSILEPGEQYSNKMRAVRNNYTKLINTAMTYQQYGAMMVDTYRDQANQDSKLEFLQLMQANPNLTQEQQIKLYETIYNFHLNQLLATSYLSFDLTLQKPKLGTLRFEFEKTFANLCKEYNIKTAATNTANNSFQWN